MLEPVSSTIRSKLASICVICSRHAALASSLRWVAPNVFFPRPVHALDRSSHAPSADLHALALLPVVRMLRQSRIRKGPQLSVQSRLQGFHFLGGPSWDRLGPHLPRFSALLEIAPDGRQTEAQHPRDFLVWYALVCRS